jgi:hypothetical protein
VGKSSLVICYANYSEDHSLINSAIRAAVSNKKQTLFVKGADSTSVPNYVSQFRIRALTWTSLLEILA